MEDKIKKIMEVKEIYYEYKNYIISICGETRKKNDIEIIIRKNETEFVNKRIIYTTIKEAEEMMKENIEKWILEREI